MSYDADVVAATSGRGEENWDKIIKLCDRIRDSYGATAMSSALGSVMKRMKTSDASVQQQAVTLLESCVSNCGKDFQLELTKSAFHVQVKEIMTSRSTDSKTIQRLAGLLGSWAVEFKNDSQMSGLVRYVEQLKREGLIVSTSQPAAAVSSSPTPPRGQEDADLERAIRMSLEEAQSTSSGSMYPSFSPPTAQKKGSGGRKVRAIYDFEAVEDNELTFKAGEIITVLDDSDENWWKGETQLGTGLFPANFVSTDLQANPEPVTTSSSSTGNGTSGKKQGKSKNGGAAAGKVEVNESQMDLLLEMLQTADITSTDPEENKTLLQLEDECKAMKPVVERNITHLDKQLSDMQDVSEKLQESFALYRKLLQEGPRLSEMPLPAQTGPYSSEPPSQAPPPYQPESLSQARAPVTGYYTEQQHQAHFQSYSAPYAQSFAAGSGPSPGTGFYPQQAPAQPAATFTNQYPSSTTGQHPALTGSQSSPQLPHYHHQQQPPVAAAPAQPMANSGWVQPSLSPQPSSIYQPQSIPYQPLI